MSKSFRTIALTSVLSLTLTPMLVAEPMGTNPRPPAASTSSWSARAYTVLAYFGL